MFRSIVKLRKENADLRRQVAELTATAGTWKDRWSDEHEKYSDLAESVRRLTSEITGACDDLYCESLADV